MMSTRAPNLMEFHLSRYKVFTPGQSADATNTLHVTVPQAALLSPAKNIHPYIHYLYPLILQGYTDIYRQFRVWGRRNMQTASHCTEHVSGDLQGRYHKAIGLKATYRLLQFCLRPAHCLLKIFSAFRIIWKDVISALRCDTKWF